MATGRIPGGGGSPLTAKGDLYGYSTTQARVPVGANNTVLTADSAEATGLKWAAPDPLTTKGDLFTYSTTEARLPVGTNGQTLVANSATATGLEWAAAAAGSMTLLATTTLSGTSVVVSSISQSYKQLYVVGTGITWASANYMFIINPNSVASQIEVGGVRCVAGTATASQESTLAPIGVSTVASNSANGFALFFNNYTSTGTKPISYYGRTASGSNTTNFAGASFHSAAITSLQYTTTAGTHTFNGGTILLYGVN